MVSTDAVSHGSSPLAADFIGRQLLEIGRVVYHRMAPYVPCDAQLLVSDPIVFIRPPFPNQPCLLTHRTGAGMPILTFSKDVVAACEPLQKVEAEGVLFLVFEGMLHLFDWRG